MNDMQSIIEYLIKFGQENNVFLSVSFENDIGCVWIRVKFRRGDKCIDHLLYYVPCGDKTIDNFRLYNPHVDMELQMMISELNDKEEEE